MTQGFWKLNGVTDEGLVAELRGLLAAEGRVEARVVAHLAELDERRIHLRGGLSLFAYCQARLGMSEYQAHCRIVAARAARRFPVVFELLEQRAMHLTALVLIGKYLNEENHRELLAEACRKTKRQILELLARRFPKEVLANQWRELPPPPGAFAAGRTGALEPLTQEMYRLHLNIDRETLAELELARDLMSHANPTGDLSVVVKRALRELVSQLQKARFGQVQKPRARPRHQEVEGSALAMPSQPRRETRNETSDAAKRADFAWAKRGSPRSAEVAAGVRGAGEAAGARAEGDRAGARGAGEGTAMAKHEGRRAHISSEVRRQIVARDGLCCTFVAPDGTRCAERAFLQIHHDHAWSKGGADTFENLRLLCGAHNRMLANDPNAA